MTAAGVSADVLKRIDYFNLIVGQIFAQLYENFPVPTNLNEAAIAAALGVSAEDKSGGYGSPVYEFGDLPNGDSFYDIFTSARLWLHDEGFIRAEGDWAHIEPVLTAKALAVMNAVPPGLTGGKSLGSQITDAAKGAGKSAGNAALGDLVGQVLGAAGGFAKGLLF